eukprot:1136132-Pelagomonas_calceolata.AAC.1
MEQNFHSYSSGLKVSCMHVKGSPKQRRSKKKKEALTSLVLKAKSRLFGGISSMKRTAALIFQAPVQNMLHAKETREKKKNRSKP